MTKWIGLMLAALAVLIGGAAVNTLSAQQQSVAGLWVGSITADDGSLGIVNVTLKQGIEKMIKAAVPEVREVIDTTDHKGGTNPFYQASEK